MGMSAATLPLKGSGEHLRLRVTKAPDPLANVASVSGLSCVEKAMGEAIRDALAAGRRWAKVGHALGSMPTRRWTLRFSSTLRDGGCGRGSGTRTGRARERRAEQSLAGTMALASETPSGPVPVNPSQRPPTTRRSCQWR